MTTDMAFDACWFAGNPTVFTTIIEYYGTLDLHEHLPKSSKAFKVLAEGLRILS